MRVIYIILFFLFGLSYGSKAQHLARLEGTISDGTSFIPSASVTLVNTSYHTYSDVSSYFSIQDIQPGNYLLYIQADGFSDYLEEISLTAGISSREIILSKREHRLTEVVVTADKQETSSQKTPLSLTVLDSKDVQSAKIWDTKDLSALVPNLYAANPGDLRNVVSIRGITTSSYEPAVATYIDGVNQFSLDTYISQLNDIERIEVLRGPQGTLYGRNASGGVINIITKQPDNKMTGFAEIGYGNYNFQRYTLGIRTPILKNKLYFGATGMYTRKNGFFFNRSSQSSYDDMQLNQGNYFVKYQTSPRLSFQLNVKHQRQVNSGAFPLVMGIEAAFAEPFQLDQNRSTKMNDQTLNISLTTKYQNKKYVLYSQTSYQENYRYYKNPIDGDFSSYDIIAIVNDYGKQWNRNKVYMQEFRLSSTLPSDARLRWNTGLHGFVQHNPVKQGTYYGDDAGMYGSPETNFTDITMNKLTGHGVAAFGQIDYQLAPQFYVTAGLRYDYEHKKQLIGGLLLPDRSDAIITRTDTATTANYQNLSPKIGLNYDIAKSHLLYGLYSRGFRSGGISPLAGDPSQPPLVSYAPEYSNNFEIGSKNMWLDNRLKLNIALFYTRITNGQIPVLIMPEALSYIQNASRLTSRGFDVEWAAIPLKGLEVVYNFGYTDAAYDDLTIIVDGSNKDMSHNKQIFTPKTTSFLSMQYTHPVTVNGSSKLFARLEHKNIGKQYFNLANTLGQDQYTLWNSRIGFQHKQVEIALWGTNLTNKKYIGYAYDFGAVNLGAPRIYGLTIKSIF